MRHLYILIILICVLSCTNEEGVIPSVNLWDEHYTEADPKLFWERNCSTTDDAEITSMGVMGDKVFVFLSNETMRIYNSTNAQLINENAHDDIFDDRNISDFALRERGSFIYVIDKNNYQVLRVDKASGSISDIFAPSLSDNIRRSFGMEIMGDDIYFFKYDATDQFSFVKYNFITREEEELHSLSGIELDASANQAAIYSPDKGKFYACAETEDDAFIIFSIDPVTAELNELFRYTGELERWLTHPTDELLLQDNKLIFKINEDRLFGINVETGKILWENQSRQIENISTIFIHLDRLYIISHGDLIEVDIDNGEILWESPSFCEWSIFDLVPGIGLAVTAIEESELDDSGPGFSWNDFDRATIYGLKVGQRLVEWDIEHPFGNNLFFRDICYYENDTSRHIYIAANNYLFKYDWPL